MARRLTFAHADKRRRPFWRDERLLGKHLIDQQQEHILIVGSDKWTRQEVVDTFHVGNFGAAKNISRIAATLQVENLADMASRFSMEELFKLPGWGIVTMFVFLCALESQQRDPIRYIDRKPDNLVTLATEKDRIRKQRIAAEAATRKPANHTRRRKAAS